MESACLQFEPQFILLGLRMSAIGKDNYRVQKLSVPGTDQQPLITALFLHCGINSVGKYLNAV